MNKLFTRIKITDFMYLIPIIVIALATYLVTLHALPPGTFNDETDIGYEAYSILKTGRDQWGNFFPLQYFSGFGGTRLQFIVYWTVPFVALFGLNTDAVRLAGVFAGLTLVIGFFLLLRHYFPKIISVTASLVLIFTPWFWGITRTTNEAVLALTMIVWGTYFLVLSRIKPQLFLLSAIFFSFSIYSYYSSQVFIPLFVFTLFLGLSWLRKENWKFKITSILLLILICAPLAFKTLTGGGSAIRLQQVGFFGNISSVGGLNQKRGDCLEKAPIKWCQINYNKQTLWFTEATTNYLNHFSPSFLFGDNWFIGVIPSGRLFFFPLLLGLVGGFYGLAKNKIPGRPLWLSWLLLAPIADSLTGNGHGMRAFLMIPPLVIIGVVGWKIIFDELILKQVKQFWIVTLFVLFLIELASFLTNYSFYFPKRYSVYSHYPYRPLIKYLLSVEDNYPEIYISSDNQGIEQYSFYLFYAQYDPKLFQEGKNVVWERESKGWIWVKQIGKWHFVKSLPSLKDVPEGSLLIGTKNEIQSIGKPRIIYLVNQNLLRLQEVNHINLLSGDTAFVISKIMASPPSKAILSMLENEAR